MFLREGVGPLMYPYFALMAYILLVGMLVRPSKSKRRKVVFLALTFVVLAVMAGIRSNNVGMDTMQYYNAYTFIGRQGMDSFGLVRYEPGFTALCLVLYQISHDPQLLILVTSAITNGLVAVFLYHNSDDVVLSAFLFVALTVYTQYLCLMRQALAVAILINAVTLLAKGKRASFVVLVLFAAVFHKLALVGLVFLLAAKLSFSWRHVVVYIALFAVAFIYATVLSNVVASLLSRETLYRNEYMGSNYFGALIRTLFYAVLVFVAVNYIELGKRRGIIEDDAATRIIEHSLMLWLLFSVLGMRIQIWGRVSCAFQPFILVALPLALKVPQLRERTFIVALVCVAAVAYFTVIGVFRPEWQGAVPYETGVSGLMALMGLT